MNSTVAESPFTLGVKAGLRRYPGVYAICRDLVYLSYALRLGLWRALLGLPDRVVSLGRQQIFTWEAPFPAFSQSEQLADWLQARGIQVHQGRYALYLPPQDRLEGLIPAIVQSYPDNCGFKILKDLRHPLRANYLQGNSEIQAVRARLTGSPQDQLITANYLHSLKIGPRAWDVCCWFAEGTDYSVFVVDHVAGQMACDRKCAEFLANLKELTRSSFLRIPVPAWETKKDFRNPDCAGNLLLPLASSLPQYIDFQNFRLRHPVDWTKRVVDCARREVQRAEPPGNIHRLDAPAIKEIHKRWELVETTLRRSEIDVQNRLVMDWGCGMGWMLQKALASGAAWALGWDDSPCAAHAEPMLFSLGATRFHIQAAGSQPGYSRMDDVPAYLRPLLHDSVVLCPLIAVDSGILQDLERIPWRAIVCHGHPAEHEGDLLDRVRHIDPHGLRCAATATLSPRNSQPWRIVVLVRGHLRSANAIRHQFSCQSIAASRSGRDA